jgi:alkylated DNA repair dioxygenase AlkB
MQLFDNQDFIKNNLPFLLPEKKDYDWHFDEKNEVFVVKIPNGELLYAPHFFDVKKSDEVLNNFLENNLGDWKKVDWKNTQPDEVVWKNIEWKHEEIKMFGKMILQPRFTAWYGDENKTYRYSGLTMKPLPWNENLLFLKEKIEKIAKVEFNSVLLNWYRDGKDHMGWHTDNEAELGKNPTIASLNFGATRRFLLRKNDNHEEKIELLLHHGSFLLMRGEIQHFWHHSVPKSLKINESRVNLTFRVIR